MNNVDNPQGYNHDFADVGGIRLHYVDEGEGPLVVLIHGFPYLWYTWRHQIRPLAAAGYRVVAPDLRGFGQSAAPDGVENYEILRAVGDIVGLSNTLGESVVLIGHDLGSRVAYYAASVRPDLFRAFVMLNSPEIPRAARKPSDGWKQIRAATGKRYYHDYFQNPGIADAEMNADIRKTLRSSLYSVSASASADERWRPLLNDGETIPDTSFDPERLPEWLPREAIDYYTSEYERNGFTPPLNYYRCLDRNWEQTAFLEGRKPQQPAMFIGGAVDPGREFFAAAYERLESDLPHLQSKVLLRGVGHDAAEEDPETVTQMLLHFLERIKLGV